MEKPEKTLGFLIHDVARLLRKRFEQNARDLGLTRSQWQVLAYLNRNEGIHQGALAEILDVEPITLVRLLDRLEAAGMVERRTHASDRRIRQLYLTDAARPTLARMAEIGAQTRAEALDGVADGDREKLIAVLMAMKANLVAANAAPDAAAADTANGSIGNG